MPAIGFAAGLERLLIASTLEVSRERRRRPQVAPLGDRRAGPALVLGRDVRRAGPPLRGRHARRASMKAQLRRSNT